MHKVNTDSSSAQSLDLHTANGLLNSVFAACDMNPSSVPVEVLEGWGNYKKSKIRAVRVISYMILIILVLLPMMFFKPAVTAERTEVDYTAKATYEVTINSFLPPKEVSAFINGEPVAMIRSDTGGYQLEVSENGTLTIEVTSANGQIVAKDYEVTYIDTEKPALTRSYSEDGIVYLVVRDPYSGVAFDKISAVGSNGEPVASQSVDLKAGIISYVIPENPITVTIPDNAGNSLSLMISPVQP